MALIGYSDLEHVPKAVEPKPEIKNVWILEFHMGVAKVFSFLYESEGAAFTARATVLDAINVWVLNHNNGSGTRRQTSVSMVSITDDMGIAATLRVPEITAVLLSSNEQSARCGAMMNKSREAYNELYDPSRPVGFGGGQG